MDCSRLTPALTGRAQAPPLLSRDSALFLDFDGTLVELAPTPDAVQLAPALPELLTALQGLLEGALAMITGRRLESLDRCMAPLRFAAAGLHGAQLRTAPDAAADDPHYPALAPLAAAARARFGGDARLLVEDKGAAVALHYRLAPERRADCEAFMHSQAQDRGLDLVAGHQVIEARPPGVNKGVGLRHLAGLAPFAGRRPVFVGDDRTDEDAIVAAQQLGGIGIRVGDQPSAAAHRLADVAATHRWLQASREALARGRA